MELRDYQKAMVKEQLTRKNLLVVAPMGAGKTLATLSALTTLIYRGDVTNALIIAPKRVSMSVWAQEVEKCGLSINVRFCKTALDIKLFLLEPAYNRVCVCSVTRIQEIPHGIWDCVILDESTLFGNKKAGRSKEVRRICNKNPNAKAKRDVRYIPGGSMEYRIELSGSPVHRGYEKLWHQMFLLDGGKALGKTLTEFRSKYMRVKYQISGVRTVWEINPVMVAQLHKDVRHLVYMVKDAVKLPPILEKKIYVNLPPKRRIEYDAFETSSIIHFQEENKCNDPYGGKTKTLIAFAASARGIKLRQLASGCVYTSDDKKTYSVTHTEKIEALKEVRECYDGGLLVAYQFRSEYEELKKAFPEARRLDTDQDITDWNNGDISIALVHPASVGHGLNLQFGGHVLVWFSLTYDAELYAQFNKRLHRPGQKETVSMLWLLAKDTIDEKMLDVLQQREATAEEFTNI